MTARLLEGAAVAAAMRERAAAAVRSLAARGVVPRLEVILVGDDPASRAYVGSKGRACAQVGIRSATHHLPAGVRGEELSALIAGFNADPDVDGILLQLPLPKPLDGRASSTRRRTSTVSTPPTSGCSTRDGRRSCPARRAGCWSCWTPQG
jgi:methylenetetrahydrofolate dehydrogenase (NADP+)/methenyltetrahydrofolate cyclohydrolase